MQKFLRLINFQIFQNFLAVASAGVSRLSTLVLLLLSSQVMAAEDFGIFTLLFMVSGMVSAVVSGGGDMWLNQFTRYHSSSEGRSPFVSRSYLLITGGIALVFFALSIFLIFLSMPLFGTNTVSIGLALVYGTVCGVNETFLAIMRTTNRVANFFLIRDLFLPILLIALVLVLKLSSSVEFFAICSGVFGAFTVSMFAFFFKHEDIYIPKNKRATFKVSSFFPYTAGLIVNNLSSRLAAGLDSIVLSFFIPLSTLGHYRLCTQLANGFIVVQHFVFLALPWHFHSSSDRLEKRHGIGEIQNRQRLLISCALPALIVLILFSNKFLAFLGAEAVNLQAVFIVVLLLRFCDILWGPLHERLISNGKILEDLQANILMLATWLLVFSICFSYFSPITASCIGIMFSAFLGQFLRYNYLKKNNLTMSPRAELLSNSI